MPTRFMEDRRTRQLSLSLLVSVLLHVLAAVLLAVAPAAARHDASYRTETPSDEATPEEPEPIRLGTDRDAPPTVTWIGFETPTEHIAEQSSVEQPELTMDPATGATAAAPITPPAPPAPSSSDASPPADARAETTPAANDPAPAQPAPSRADASPAALSESEVEGSNPALIEPPAAEPSAARESDQDEPALSEAPPGAEPIAPPAMQNDPAEESEDGADKPEIKVIDEAPAAPAIPTNANADSMPPVLTPPVPKPQSPSASPGELDQGQQADRESNASSRLTAEWKKLGQPLAGGGLEIKTRRPRFTQYTRIMGANQNPVVRVHFRKDGKVDRVEMIESSGNPDVDRPVINAVYDWRATGARLSSVPEPSPPGTLALEFRILL